jgi:hypothetical protein
MKRLRVVETIERDEREKTLLIVIGLCVILSIFGFASMFLSGMLLVAVDFLLLLALGGLFYRWYRVYRR